LRAWGAGRLGLSVFGKEGLVRFILFIYTVFFG